MAHNPFESMALLFGERSQPIVGNVSPRGAGTALASVKQTASERNANYTTDFDRRRFLDAHGTRPLYCRATHREGPIRSKGRKYRKDRPVGI